MHLQPGLRSDLSGGALSAPQTTQLDLRGDRKGRAWWKGEVKKGGEGRVGMGGGR